jgi:[acyl-carrier-protein] S-malonyltransferase
VRLGAEVLGADPVPMVRGGGPEIFRNSLAQPLLCLAELATWAALRDALPAPRVFAGYSLGELGAYGCAGALDPPTTVALALRRAALMDGASPEPSGLLAVRGIAWPRAGALAERHGGEVAIVNGPAHCVVGGRETALEAVARDVLAAGATTVQRLPVGVAAHTSLLEPATAPFAEALAASALSDPPVPVLAGVSGEPVRRRSAAIATLSTQLARRIVWDRCLTAAVEMGCTVFVELGPGNALSRMALEASPGIPARSVADFRSIAGVARWVKRAGA